MLCLVLKEEKGIPRGCSTSSRLYSDSGEKDEEGGGRVEKKKLR